MPLPLLALTLALSTSPDPAFARVQSALTSGGPGCALGVEQPGAAPVFKAWGRSDLERDNPATVATVFEAGSVSKQFTAAAVALLASRSALSLDDDVRRFVPEMPRYERPITIRMLLGHTSGLRNWDDLVELQGWPEGRAAHTQDEVLRILARQSALNFTPGTEYSYSNSNYMLLAVVAGRAAKQPFAAFMREALFEPLGLKDTRWRDDFTAVVPGRAQAYSKGAEGAWRLDMPFADVIGQGGLLTTVGDLVRWNAVLSAPPPEAAGWVGMMTERGRLTDGTVINYALGLEYERVAGRAVLSHAGATAGYRSYLARVPESGVSLALLCNDGSLNTEDLGPELLGTFLGPPPPTAPRPAAAPVMDVKAYAGSFRDPRTEALIPVTVKDGGLSLDGGPVWLPVEPGVFRNAAGTRRLSFDATGARLRFTRVGNAPVELRRLPPNNLKTADPRAYAGAFESRDLDAVEVFAKEGDALVWTDPSGTHHPLKPVYRDVFEDPANSWTLVFRRDRAGPSSPWTSPRPAPGACASPAWRAGGWARRAHRRRRERAGRRRPERSDQEPAQRLRARAADLHPLARAHVRQQPA